ncbi:MAG: HAD family hydrolase [Chloroflexi bacterium]|nr:HAD family hydrolase [Chloroflexota bacterium]
MTEKPPLQHIKAVAFDLGGTLLDIARLSVQGAPPYTVIPGVVETLAALEGRVICCVASNSELAGHVLARDMAAVGISGYFTQVFTSHSIGVGKPNPRFFRALLSTLEIAPGACVMIGDSYPADIVGAKAVGMHTIWYAPRTTAAQTPDADVVITSMGGVIPALEQIEASLA